MNRRSVLGGIAAGLAGLMTAKVSLGTPRCLISELEIKEARRAHGKCSLCGTMPTYVVKYHNPEWGLTENSFQHFPEWDPQNPYMLPVMFKGVWTAGTVAWFPVDCVQVTKEA